ncbi:hypothetical protein CDL12_09116 [Handroanthus impetiginosus]|uniref:RING-type domain-containing protein n=1 Tax=Handroanthus impetiginosus TaxID=429701 RepID=A0A2G9HL23_9LAMI|nr:hypothetical protein CDL12_09116 [Handroanthus impetiginosus]
MPTFTTTEHHRFHRRAPPRYLIRGQRKILFFFLKCVIMVFVMSLFLFFLGFAAVVLLHYLFVSNTFDRRCSRLFHPTTAADDEDVFIQANSAHLPYVAYKAMDFPRMSDCAICLDSFLEGDECRNIPVCKHLFHAKCLDRWIRKMPTCPFCRTRADLDYVGLSGRE